jgi:multiple sugar transport system permease protein
MSKRLGILAGALAIAVTALLPPLLIAKQAFSPEVESYAWPPTWIPHTPTLENFRQLHEVVDVTHGLFLSLFVAALTVASALLIALPAAWVATRRARFDRGLDAALVLSRVFPSMALAVPLAVVFVRVGLYNHPWGIGLWIAHTLLALPFAFFTLRNGLAGVPQAVEEAARLDGAAPSMIFWHVVLPVIRPSLGAAALLAFLVSWDEFAYALLFQITNQPLPPLLYYLAAFGHPGLASAVAAIMLVPAILIIAVIEPALRAGVTAGSGR